MTTTRTEEIAAGIYWVGGCAQDGGLHCNPYLIVDGDEGVLIDPGSVLDFEDVYENVCSIISLEKIKYVILHHQDPDFFRLCHSLKKPGPSLKLLPIGGPRLWSSTMASNRTIISSTKMNLSLPWHPVELWVLC